MTITATITKKQGDGKINQNRKEKGFYKQLSMVDNLFNEIITLRLYRTANTEYACIWVNAPGNSKTMVDISGGGKAGGYGYHRASAAVQNALNDAGIELNKDIAGTGDAAIENALKVVMVALNYEKFGLITAHA